MAKALHLAKVTGATLLIAKLGRLSRNAAFLLTLRDSGVQFVAADMPEANDLTVGIMALVAQHEREAISRRTREALAAAKARGAKLGNPTTAAAKLQEGRPDEAGQTTQRRSQRAVDLACQVFGHDPTVELDPRGLVNHWLSGFGQWLTPMRSPESDHEEPQPRYPFCLAGRPNTRCGLDGEACA